MITPRELRLENWVRCPHGNVQIAAIEQNEVRFSDGCGGTISSIDPIPLTPELLEKAGFEDYFGGYYRKDDFGVDHSHTNGTFIIQGNGKQVRIYHLHQLQNIYYFLTNKELEINL